jgi:hypothetical protein
LVLAPMDDDQFVIRSADFENRNQSIFQCLGIALERND